MSEKLEMTCPACKGGSLYRKDWGRNPQKLILKRVFCPACGFFLFTRDDVQMYELSSVMISLSKILANPY